jgi:hypothetical protein
VVPGDAANMYSSLQILTHLALSNWSVAIGSRTMGVLWYKAS